MNLLYRLFHLAKSGSKFKGKPTYWGNLGFWLPEAHSARQVSYEVAATRLADELVSGLSLNNLNQDHALLVLGCGYGEEVRHWSMSSSKLQITALDPSAEAIHSARHHLPDISFYNTDAQSYLQTLTNERFDLVCALDCAYHFNNKIQTWREVYEYLNDRGILAFTDLVIKSPPQSWVAKIWLRVCSRLFSIPFSQWQTMKEYECVMQELGFIVRTKEVISTEVLDGFCSYVASAEFKRFESYQGKLKSRVTAYLINKLRRHDLIDYVLIQAEKKKH